MRVFHRAQPFDEFWICLISKLLAHFCVPTHILVTLQKLWQFFLRQLCRLACQMSFLFLGLLQMSHNDLFEIGIAILLCDRGSLKRIAFYHLGRPIIHQFIFVSSWVNRSLLDNCVLSNCDFLFVIAATIFLVRWLVLGSIKHSVLILTIDWQMETCKFSILN